MSTPPPRSPFWNEPPSNDNSKGLGQPKKTVDAESCILIRFHAVTYPGGPPLVHNIWFHESWTDFDDPANVFCAETDGNPVSFVLRHGPIGDAKKVIEFPDLVELYSRRSKKTSSPGDRARDSSTNDRARDSSANKAPFWAGFKHFPSFKDCRRSCTNVAMWLLKFVLATLMMLVITGFMLLIILCCIGAIIKLKQHLTQNSEHGTLEDAGVPQSSFFVDERPPFVDDWRRSEDPNAISSETPTDAFDAILNQPQDKEYFSSETIMKPGSNEPITEIKSAQSEEVTHKDDHDNIIVCEKKLNKIFVRVIGGPDHHERVESVMQGLACERIPGKTSDNTSVEKTWWRRYF
ncbi:hypothetical protein NM208_g524 [Fusarium decemcellulare]|uniref:Uncharacterized protein n=1 Tax=Fusarium decemcellulare TaxID=57161 RepID=A0ACC1SZ39_9HYPO|nr:hypothetical protein NM208_g524 [Fusarium decemcellulare]